MSEPLLRELHQRGEQLTVAALSWVAPVYQHMPSVAEVIELPFKHGSLQWAERRALARQWRGKFDRAYVMPNSLKSALIPWLADIPLRIGYHGESRYVLLNQRLPNPTPGERPPMVDHYLALSGTPSLNAKVIQPVLYRPAETVRQTLQTFGLEAGAYSIIAPGAEYGPAKMWPVQHVADLCKLMQERVLLVASSKEKAMCQTITDMAGSAQVINLAGMTDLGQAFDLISAARKIVTNDSGLMHIAAAFRVPQVAVFGSSSPHHTPPLSDKAHVIWLADDIQYTPPLDCSPCYARTCRLGHTRCLNDIKPERVAQVLRSL